MSSVRHPVVSTRQLDFSHVDTLTDSWRMCVRLMANQRIAAVAVPCCTTVTHPVRDIYQAGSSLPRVLGSLTRESQPHMKISITHRALPVEASTHFAGLCQMFPSYGDNLWIQLRHFVRVYA